MRNLLTKRKASGLLVLASAGLLCGSVIAAQRVGEPLQVDALHESIQETPVARVADIASIEGRPARGVYVQVTTTGHICVWDAPSATSMERGGGCNPADDPLGGSAISANLAYDGGPAIAGVRDARLSGLGASEVASVRVLMSDGSYRTVRLKAAKVGSAEFNAFGYRFKRADLRNGIGPVAIVAYDANGAEIARQTTGIG